jgi:hypothetical protein
MNNNAVQVETDTPSAKDSRIELVERIVASPAFVRSPRLCNLLTHVCTLSLEGRADEINEINIGVAVFDRPPNYDPSVDGIVRSHASRLRQRLELYFREEGSGEPIRLSIPKGAYLPVFELCKSGVEPPVDSSDRTLVEETSPALAANSVEPRSTPAYVHPAIWILSLALAVACGTIAYLLLHVPASAVLHSAPTASHPLWGRFFGADQSAMVVCSDAGLTALQVLSGHRMKLEDYLNTDYRNNISASSGADSAALKSMVAGRYTSIVNLQIASRLFRLPDTHEGQIQIRYARDLRANDLTDNSVILLGSTQTNPWVELFEPGMNFTMLADSNRETTSVLNRTPRAGELSHYDSKGTDPQQTVYAVVALRHSLGSARPVLILEGTSMAGTEAAADFVLEDMRLLLFLNTIRRPDGSIPYFEVLLQSNSLDGNASQSKIVAYRTSQD